MAIRPLKASDSAQVIGNLFSELTHGVCKSVDLEALINSSTKCLVIEEEGSIIGFGSLVIYYLPTAGEVGKIEDVVIDEKSRGKGLGRKLLEELIELAKKNGLKKVQLTSNPKRIEARALYLSLGFEMRDTNVFVKEM